MDGLGGTENDGFLTGRGGGGPLGLAPPPGGGGSCGGLPPGGPPECEPLLVNPEPLLVNPEPLVLNWDTLPFLPQAKVLTGFVLCKDMNQI